MVEAESSLLQTSAVQVRMVEAVMRGEYIAETETSLSLKMEEKFHIMQSVVSTVHCRSVQCTALHCSARQFYTVQYTELHNEHCTSVYYSFELNDIPLVFTIFH